MVEKEALIAAVFKRRPIWDPRHNKYRKRSVLQTMWNQIERELGEDRETLKSRWRGLRDYFGRELRKYNSYTDTAPAVSTWPYFGKMFFLKDIWKNRGEQGRRVTITTLSSAAAAVRAPRKVNQSVEDAFIPGMLIPELELQISNDGDDDDDDDDDDEDDDEDNIGDNEDNAGNNEGANGDDDIEDEANNNQKEMNFDNKKIREKLENNEKFSSQETLVAITEDKKRKMDSSFEENDPSKKMKQNFDDCEASTSTLSPLALSSITSDADYDEDLLFFMSILPDFKILPRNRQIYMKFKIQEMLYEQNFPKNAEEDAMITYLDFVN